MLCFKGDPQSDVSDVVPETGTDWLNSRKSVIRIGGMSGLSLRLSG